VALIYIVANIALGIHLFHGSWSLFQSLGLNNPRWNSARRVFATAFAAIVMVGNVSFPIAVQLGIVSADDNADCATSGGRIVTCELYQEGA
jgi:succinate dehydrogenase cytochrome b subunit